jgi:hypothetical protein
MTSAIQPFHLLVVALAGWLNRHQQVVIFYLIEENRMFKEQLEGPGAREAHLAKDFVESAWGHDGCHGLLYG